MCNKNIKYLEWDSDFFQKKIGTISGDSDNFEESLNNAKSEGYQLIYLFSNINLTIDNKVLKQFNGHLADRKVLYEKTIMPLDLIKKDAFIIEYKDDKLTPELEKLAYLSGEHSRYKHDKNFKENDFYRLYKIWMENSIKHLIADKVFVVIENNSVKGMVTLKIDKEKGQIGLISVLPSAQGKGYGKTLVNNCEIELAKQGINRLEVPTQANNKLACQFYEKYGFQIKSITNIYHFWL